MQQQRKAGTQKGVPVQVAPQRPERVILIAVDTGAMEGLSAGESIDELQALCEAAGAEVVASVVQRRDAPDASSYIGGGKLEELAALAEAEQADLIVSDDELRPAQLRRIEAAVPGLKVLDRTQLILDIFAQRARSAEGKLQVELAQLRYLLPRLAGSGTALSRLGGGIGTRGPGESKLENDRRRIRARIADLRASLATVRARREQQRSARRAGLHPVVALVGYTNAGKSTLLNTLSGAGVEAADRLFETLDPTVREVCLPGGDRLLLADTVGFIQKLPHELVAAFRATLEEVVQADLLLHVIDVSNPRWPAQASAVFEVLESLGCAGSPMVIALNKCEVASEADKARARRELSWTVPISAKEGLGLQRLLETIRERLPEPRVRATYRFGFDEAATMRLVHEFGRVLATRWDQDGAIVECEVRGGLARRLAPFRTQAPLQEMPEPPTKVEL